MTLAPSVIRPQGKPPRGFAPVWKDGRLNSERGPRTQDGETQTNLIWNQTVPRTLRAVPTLQPVVTITRPRAQRGTPFWEPRVPDQVGFDWSNVTRMSTRSDPAADMLRADR
jgi:hypothetical protein